MTPPSTAPHATGGEFQRKLRLLDTSMLVIGSMIGSGIFIVSADIARTVGSPGYLLLVWLIAGIMTVICALSYGELAGMMPHAGGQYVYLREAYNPLIGFLYGWTLFLVIQTGTIAAVAVAFAKFTAVLFPSVADTNVLMTLAGIKITAARLLAVGTVFLLTYFSTRGIQGGKILQDIFTSAKTLALIGLILLGFVISRSAATWNTNFADFWNPTWTHFVDGKVVSVEPLSGLTLLAAICVAMVGSLFAADAWNNVTFTAGEVVKPTRNIPLGLVIGAGSVILLYLAANVSYLMVLPLRGTPDAADVLGRGIQFASFDRVGTAATTVMFGDIATTIMAVLIMVSTFGCNNGLILAGARVTYAMARDNLFFAPVGRLNKSGVPAVALWVQALWTSILCLSGTYGDLLDYVVFAVLVFYILTMIGIFILRRTRPDAERPYRAFGYPVLPALYIAAAAIICSVLLIYKPTYTWPGVFIVLLGIPVYFVWKRFAGSAARTE